MTASTVFCLAGYLGQPQLIPPMLGGEVTNGNTVIPFYYNNVSNPFVSGVEAGAQLLDKALHATTGPMVGFGHSEGAVVCTYWLVNFGPDSTIEPADLSFMLLGNSVNPFGGACGPESGTELQNWFSGLVMPTETNYETTCFIRQYDGWADWPCGPFNPIADANALAGQNLVHCAYNNVSLTDPNNLSYTKPGSNITYTYSPTQPLPLYGTVRNSWVDELDQDTRAGIELSHIRPVDIPLPSYS